MGRFVLVRFRAVAFMVTAFLLTGCGDDPLSPDLNPGSSGSLTMLVDGVTWTATSVSALNQSGVVGIGASDLASVGFGFAFQGTTTGTYTVGVGFANNATYSEAALAWSAITTSGSGTITVTAFTADRVAGTFSFEVEAVGTHTPATRSITGGTFDIPIG